MGHRSGSLEDAEFALAGSDDLYTCPDYPSFNSESLEVRWVHLGDVRAGAELMKRIEQIAEWVVRARIYHGGDKHGERTERIREATREVATRAAERLLAGGYDCRHGASVSTYVGSLCNGYLLHWLRRERLKASRESLDCELGVGDDEAPAASPIESVIANPDAHDPHDDAELALVVDVLREAVSKLPARQQKSFVELYINGRTSRAAAKRVGLHYSRVWSHSRAAAAQVRAELSRRLGQVGLVGVAERPECFIELYARRERQARVREGVAR